jgi:hypothetical protein
MLPFLTFVLPAQSLPVSLALHEPVPQERLLSSPPHTEPMPELALKPEKSLTVPSTPLSTAQTSPMPSEEQERIPPQPRVILRPQEVRPLPNQLDQIPVFNSNSPELVMTPGIILSTFKPAGKAHPEAHLDYTFNGRFDVFAHHVARARSHEDMRTIYLGILAHNPTDRPILVDFLEGATYMSQPDAPFIELPPHVPNPHRLVYAGPGSRVTDEVLRDHLQARLPLRQIIRPGQSELLLNVPLLFRGAPSLVNGRSTFMRLESNGPLHLASMVTFSPLDEATGFETRPTLRDWEELLQVSPLAVPRDIAPSPPEQRGEPFYYGRVSGVAIGSQWVANLTDPGRDTLQIPPVGRAISYGLSLLDRGTLGTGQIQSAPMVRRYPDTAYRAHGNYGVEYRLTLPLVNNTRFYRTVTVALETPIKEDRLAGGLRFFDPPPRQVFFRGTVEVDYVDDRGRSQTDYYHLVQHRGQQGEPLVTLTLRPGQRRTVRVNFLYPPDSTPPQVLTVQTVR